MAKYANTYSVYVPHPETRQATSFDVAADTPEDAQAVAEHHAATLGRPYGEVQVKHKALN